MAASKVLANPTVVQVNINPATPPPLSTITFNATILCNETIEEVRLLVQECREDLCFVNGYNISMEKIDNNTYEAQCVLNQEDATKIKYYFRIFCNGTWYTTNITFLPLAIDTKTNTTQNPQDPAPIPGFEIPLCVLSVVLVLTYNFWRRKSGEKI